MRLWVVLVSSCVAAAWAGCHRNRDKDHRWRENCTALGFGDVPPGFEPTTQVMLFPRNRFSSLSWSSFQIFTEIYELDFTGNEIVEVTPSPTPILPTLSVLRLGWNRLKSLPAGSFSACPALTEVYLDHNAVDSLSGHAFSGLSKLEVRLLVRWDPSLRARKDSR
ncbi:Leucine-rich repeat-containing G-protein coupled receptor 4 [Liparis tanakae]|uniref:Leucine-rich repeat-containing G-protein coupled receptor 4 n=1 Tax=Liparis tanakae TaxID=230148 RepID=A0A4Z2HHC0_9TELE|nr:Leucine-rich repeat-containing G-protein coupled receptor 4 [Liparis tanakae]